MKKLLLLAMISILLMTGCGSGKPANNPDFEVKTGGEGEIIIMIYQKSMGFSHFEIYVGVTAGFTIPGWDEATETWTGVPNELSEWDGITKTLKAKSSDDAISVSDLQPGVTYYARCSAVNYSDKRSEPSAEQSVVAGGEGRGSLLVAACDADANTKAGADFVCDGISDQEEINLALTRIADLGKKVLLSSGTFTVDGSIILGSNDTLEGQGASTLIKFKNAISDTIYMIDTDGTEHAAVMKLKLDGNKANVSGLQYGIRYANAINCSVFQVTIDNFIQNGIVLGSCTKTIISNSKIQNSGSDGVIIIGSGNTITACAITNSNRSGIVLTGSDNNILSSNTIQENLWEGITFNSSSNNSVSGCTVIKNGQDGILINNLSNDNTISNNPCTANGQNTNNTYSNIYIGNLSDRNNIQGNTCRKGVEASKSKYGIRINNGSDNLITNNDCYTGGETAGISDAGTGTSFGNGDRMNDGSFSTTPN